MSKIEKVARDVRRAKSGKSRQAWEKYQQKDHMQREKEDLWQKPYTHRKIQKATWQHKNATKNFDYTTIADRLRTVSWGNDSNPTGVIKAVYGIPTFPLTAKSV